MAARRVLHVAQPVEAGVPAVVRQLVAHQVRLGWDVCVACPPDGSLPRWAADAGARVLDWPASRAPGPSVAAEWRRLRRLISECRPDLVHLHSSKAGLVGRLAIRGRRPTVYQPHAWSFLAVTGAMRRASTVWERVALRWNDAVVCVSEAEARTARDAGLRGADGLFTVCPNGVDTERFAPADEDARAAARLSLDLPPSSAVAVCVGRLSEQKGQDVLLAAWSRLAATDATLVLVGDGPARAELTEAAARAGARVVFAGQVADARPYFAAADLVVAPSRWEGASLVTREAMASGLSQVITDVDGARESLGDHADGAGAGAIVAVDDVAGLADAIGRRLDSPELRRREGERARARAETLFALPTALAALDSVYNRVLAASRP